MSDAIAVISVVVALVAMLVALIAWRTPFPADPTRIPRFGSAEEFVVLDDPNRMDEFFVFLERHPGRKVLIYALRTKQPNDADGMETEGLTSTRARDGLTDSLYVPKRRDSEDAVGIYYQQGSWRIRGYFANVGIVHIAQGFREHRLTPLSDVEAVT